MSIKELDFIHEGRNAEQCAADMKKFDFIHVPNVRWDLTSTVSTKLSGLDKYFQFFIVFKRILTAEWCDGYKITDLDRIKADRFSLREIDQNLFSTFAEQIFSTGFVHADPHPGNGTFLPLN